MHEFVSEALHMSIRRSWQRSLLFPAYNWCSMHAYSACR